MDVIIGVSCAIIVLLFALQPLGISRLASCFAPVVVVWLLLNFCYGVYVGISWNSQYVPGLTRARILPSTMRLC